MSRAVQRFFGGRADSTTSSTRPSRARGLQAPSWSLAAASATLAALSSFHWGGSRRGRADTLDLVFSNDVAFDTFIAFLARLCCPASSTLAERILSFHRAAYALLSGDVRTVSGDVRAYVR